MLKRKSVPGSATETGPLDAEKLVQATAALKLERTTAPNSAVFEDWMPPDTRTETTTGIKWKAQENNYQNENKHCEVMSGWLKLPSM